MPANSNPPPDKELIATLTPEALSKLGLSPEQLTAETPATVWGPKTLQHPDSPFKAESDHRLMQMPWPAATLKLPLVRNPETPQQMSRRLSQQLAEKLAMQAHRQHPEVLGLEPGSMPELEATLDKLSRAIAQQNSPVALGHPLL